MLVRRVIPCNVWTLIYIFHQWLVYIYFLTGGVYHCLGVNDVFSVYNVSNSIVVCDSRVNVVLVSHGSISFRISNLLMQIDFFSSFTPHLTFYGDIYPCFISTDLDGKIEWFEVRMDMPCGLTLRLGVLLLLVLLRLLLPHQKRLFISFCVVLCCCWWYFSLMKFCC